MTEPNYQDKIGGAMSWLSHQPKSVFIGEGLKNAGEIYGTLASVSPKKCIEMPIAENLIVGSAIGLAMQGFKPIVVFQRMDFMLIASDAIINHLALITKMSGGQYILPVIIRAIIGSQDPKFEMGEQHKHDFQHIFEPYIKTIRLGLKSKTEMVYMEAYKRETPTLIIEERDLYDKNNR